jgi:hypothetical protein
MSNSNDVSRLSNAMATARDPSAFASALNGLVDLFDAASSSAPLPHLCEAGAVAEAFVAATRQLLALFAISSKVISEPQRRVRDRLGARLERCVECMLTAHHERVLLVPRWVRLFDVAMETVTVRLRRADNARVSAALTRPGDSDDIDVLLVPIVELFRFSDSLLATSSATHAALVDRLVAIGVLLADNAVDAESPALLKLREHCNVLAPGALRLVVSRHAGLAQLAELLLDHARVGDSLGLVSAVRPIMHHLLRTAASVAKLAVPPSLAAPDDDKDDERLCVDQSADAVAVWQALAYVFEIFDPPSLPQRLVPHEQRAFLAVCVDAVRLEALPALAVVSIAAELLETLCTDAWIDNNGDASRFFADAVTRVCAEPTDDAEPILRLSRAFLLSLTSADDVRAAEQLIFDAAFHAPRKPPPARAVTDAFVDAAIARLVRTFAPGNSAQPPFYCIERWAAPLVELACTAGDGSDAARCLGAALLYDMRAFAQRLQRRAGAISVEQSPALWHSVTAAIPRLPSAVFDAAFVDGQPLPLPLLGTDDRAVLEAFGDALAQFLAGAAAHRALLWGARESFARVAAALVTDVRASVRRAAVQLLVASFPPKHQLPLYRLARQSPALGEAVAIGIALTCKQLIAESREAPSARCYAVVRATSAFLCAARECPSGKALAAAFGSVWRLFVTLLKLTAKRAFVVTAWACVSELPAEDIDFDAMAHTHQLDVLERFVAVIGKFVARKELDADEMHAYLLDGDRARAAAAPLDSGAARLQFVLSRAALPLVETVTLNDRATPSDMRDARWTALQRLLAELTDAGHRMLPAASRRLLNAVVHDENYKRCGSDEQRSALNALIRDWDDDISSSSVVSSSTSSSSSSSSSSPPRKRLTLSSSSSSSSTSAGRAKRSSPHRSISENSFDPNLDDGAAAPPQQPTVSDDLSIELISLSSDVAEPEAAIHTSDSNSDDDDEDDDDSSNLTVRQRYRDLLVVDNGHKPKKPPTPKRAPPVPARPAAPTMVPAGNSSATDAALRRALAREAEADAAKPRTTATTMFVPKAKTAVAAAVRSTTGGGATSASTATVTIGDVKYSIGHLRRTVLSWDAHRDLTQGGAESETTAKRPADRFGKWTEYRDAFLPLLLIEFRAAVTSDLSECDFAANTVLASVVLGSQVQKNWTLEFDLAFPRTDAQELIRKNSLLLVYGSAPDGGVPAWADVRDHALAQVLEVKRFVKDAPRNSTVVRVCVSQAPRNTHDPNARRLGLMTQLLHRKGDVCVTVIGSMSTLLREFESLNEVGELELRDYLLDPTQHVNRLSATPAVDELPPALADSNRVQRDVIRTVCNLERGFVLIQGPPGTGKTRTILMLIQSLLSRAKTGIRSVYAPAFACERLLVCAPSNAAVDEICLRLAAARPDPGAPIDPRRADVVRLGQCSELVERFSLQTLADALRGGGDGGAADAASLDQQARNALGTLMDCIEKFIDAVVTPQMARDQAQQRSSTTTAASASASAAAPPAWWVRPSDSIPLFDDLMATESERDDVAVAATTTTATSTATSTRNATTKQIEYVDKLVSVDDAFELFDTLFHPLSVAPSAMGARASDTIAPHVGRLRDALRLKGSWSTLHDAVKQVRGGVGRDKHVLDGRVSEQRDRRERERVESGEQREVDVLRGARVVCATLSSSAIEAMQRAKNAGVRFETVIVDEAGQAVEPSTLVPLRHNTMRCVLVGDPKQLPPTIIANSIAAVYARSLFERLALAERRQHFQLEVQYRMHPSIRRFPSSFFYDGTLRDGPNIVSGDGKVLAAYDAPVHHDVLYGGASLLFDVRDSRESRGIANRESTSLWNQSEVECIVAIYNDLVRRHRDMLARSFVILTPYTAQLARLRRAFAAYRGAHTGGMRILTVDAAQGSECDVVLLSCVRASPGGIGFVGDVRRINVAVTRARLLRIVVGSRVALERSEAWRALINDAVELDGVRVASSPFDLDAMRQTRANQLGKSTVDFDRRSSQVAERAQLSVSGGESGGDGDEFVVDEIEEGELPLRTSGAKRSETEAQLSAAPPGKKATTVEERAKPKNLAAITARVLGNAHPSAKVKVISATSVKSNNNFQND